MSTIPPIKIAVEADTTKLNEGLKTATTGIQNVNNSVKTASSGMSAFATQLKSVGTALGVAFAGAQIVNFAKQSVMAASNMAESLSKVQVVFEDTADSVIEWSKTSADSMGISSQKALEAAGTYGNLFQALGVTKDASQEMSVNLVQLASDLGSFNNMTVDESLNALRSGLSGETEPLKRFGISLNEATLKAKAMAMGFGEIKGVMDPAIKAQVTYALVLEQTKKAQGDYARTADGTANTMKTLQARLEDAKVALGDALMPVFRALLGVLNLIIPVLTAVGKFFKENAGAIKVYAILVGTLVAAFYAYRAALIVTKVTQQAFIIIQTLMKGATLASIASTNGLAASMLVLNAAMRANPIGLIVTAIMLVGAAFIYAWKKSETFRGIVIKGAQIILNGFALLVQGIGKFLGMLSKVPGMGWAKGLSEGAEKAADAIRKTSDGLSDLKNVSEETGKGGKGNKGGSTGDSTGDLTGGVTAVTDAKKKAEEIKKTLKDVAGVYKDMNKVIADSQEKVAKATKKRDEDVAEANKRYKAEVAKANKQFNETIAKEDKKLLEGTAAAYKRNKEQIESINKDYAKRVISIEEKLQNTITNIRDKAADKSADLIQKAAEKSTDLTQKAAEKQRDIVQKSIDRLRNAFASKTGFSLADAFGMKEFGGKATGEQLLGSLKKSLSDAKNLAENAAFLQANGFSQTFIEQVVSAGPEVGNKLAESILNSSPESIKELQATFTEMENTSKNGLDDLAKSMNSGGKLATQELMDAYAQVPIDLKESLDEVNSQLLKALAENNSEMLKALAEANTEYSKAMIEAKVERDEKLAQAAKDLTEALAEMDKNYKEAVAEAKKTLDEALADAATTLADTLAEVQKTYNEAIDEIAKDTKEKIDALKEKLGEMAATLKELGAKQAAIDVMKNAPIYTPYTPPVIKPIVTDPNIYANGGRIDSAGNYNTFNQEMADAMGGGNTVNINAPVTNYNTTSDEDIGNTLVRLAKYGLVVTK